MFHRCGFPRSCRRPCRSGWCFRPVKSQSAKLRGHAAVAGEGGRCRRQCRRRTDGGSRKIAHKPSASCPVRNCFRKTHRKYVAGRRLAMARSRAARDFAAGCEPSAQSRRGRYPGQRDCRVACQDRKPLRPPSKLHPHTTYRLSLRRNKLWSRRSSHSQIFGAPCA